MRSPHPAAEQTSGSVKTLMTAAESLGDQSQPHFLDAPCQSGRRPEQTGGPVRESRARDESDSREKTPTSGAEVKKERKQTSQSRFSVCDSKLGWFSVGEAEERR